MTIVHVLYNGGGHWHPHDRCHLWHWLFMSEMLMWACSAFSFIYLCESHWDCHLFCKEILTHLCADVMRVCTHFNVHLHYHCGTIWMCSHHWGQGRTWLDFSTSGLAEGDPLPPLPEEDVDADVHQQGDDEGQVEGHHRRVDDKVRVGDGAHRRVVWERKKRTTVRRKPLCSNY